MKKSADSATAIDAADAASVSPQPLGADSLAWRLGLDRRALLVAGRALLMQVMHPVIGAGVRDFSSFSTDPWGRLNRTVGSLLTQVFGGPAATAEATRLREIHQAINGVGFDGSRYSALDPQAYAWTHLANFDAALIMRERFTEPLTADERDQLYLEWRQVGAVLGIRDHHMPADLTTFRAYVDEMSTNRLENNETARALLGLLSLTDVSAPPGLPFASLFWRLARPLGAAVLRDSTIGTLPPVLREKLGLEWSSRQELRLRAFARGVRVTAPLIPERLREYPIAYRAKQMARTYQRKA